MDKDDSCAIKDKSGNDSDSMESETMNHSRSSSFFLKTPNVLENLSLIDLIEPTSLNLNLSLKKKTDETYKWVQNFYKDKKNQIKLNLPKDELIKLKKLLHTEIDNAYKRIDKTQKASSTEKIFFSGSVYTIFIFGYLIGNCPQYVHLVYSVLFAILMPIRLITYYKMNYGYYLADLCYYVNLLLILYIWVLPDSQMLYITCCSFSWGTLSFAVITWKNKLVFHSIDKITSTFIHVLPGVVMYVITHQLDYNYKFKRFNGSIKLQNWDIMYGIFTTSLLYFIWQLSYHYFITIRKYDKIKNGKVTSFEYLRKAFAKKPIGKFVNSLPDPLPVVAFTFIQYGYQLITMSLCPLLYKYKHLCSIFVSFIFLCAAYNGATYYVDFYGKKFQNEVIKLQKEIEQLQEEHNDHDVKKSDNSEQKNGRRNPVSVSEMID